MNIIELCEVVDALRKAKAEISKAFNGAKEEKEADAFLGMLGILSDECREFCELYEKEAQTCPKLEGAEW